ncbi:MAG: DUF1499 domain-containing protein [Gammaproteobacteria bacterium]
MLASLSIVLLVVVIGLGAFALLGWWSQAGGYGAPGLQPDGRLASCAPAPNCVCSEAGGDEEHAVVPLAAGAVDWTEVADAVRAVGGGGIIVEGDYLHATFTSRIFRFTDDLELRRDGEYLQVRSASRVGHSDLGANRKRVEALRRLLTASTRR